MGTVHEINPGDEINGGRVYGLSFWTEVLDTEEVQNLQPWDSVEKLQEIQRRGLYPACKCCRCLAKRVNLDYWELVIREGVPCFVSIHDENSQPFYEPAPW
ncbi:hypothetical protein M407DRAFT_241326 [Tulasnella calospora MUT 4182]|uniref:Uncharacterized protein n=1 Tax=Tulasnella calospora MUT 4182 TaxID=1051891 RepID=A0A0C3LF70_9AGAM|nr:hypothetical protein M407DRAFT_241326 [Tulasnella calospora MUT 4182]